MENKEPRAKAIKPRSLPIPKEVNHYVLSHFGTKYYKSTDVYEKVQMLKQIEVQLKAAGFEISWSAIERRLKNMKSHYRRKKTDQNFNIGSESICWEYYEELDRIFTEVGLSENIKEEQTTPQATSPQVSNENPSQSFVPAETVIANSFVVETTVAGVASVPNPAPATPAPVKNQVTQKRGQQADDSIDPPQDLSCKRPKLIEFSDVDDIMNQCNKKPTEPASSKATSSFWKSLEQEVMMKISESIKAVDEQRIALDQQRVIMEVQRYQLDMLGYQLSQLLYKVTHAQDQTAETKEN